MLKKAATGSGRIIREEMVAGLFSELRTLSDTVKKVVYTFDRGNPLKSRAEYYLNCYANLSLHQRIELLSNRISGCQADGFLVNSIKNCNSFSAGQLMIMQQLKQKLRITDGFIESGPVGPGCFSYPDIKNRLESFFQVLDQRKMILNRS